MGTWRLFLACLVIGLHSNGYLELFNINIGTIAVTCFFFISGFLMPLAYSCHYQDFGPKDGCIRFYLNRFLRIFPIYWLSILLCLGLLGLSYMLHRNIDVFNPALFSYKVYFQNIVLLGLNQDHIWGGYYRLNNPAWTLDVEIQYYLIVPLIFYTWKYIPKLTFIFLGVISLCSFYIFLFPFNLVHIDRSLLAFGGFFFMGFLYYQFICGEVKNNLLIMSFVFILALVIVFEFVFLGNLSVEKVNLPHITMAIIISAILLLGQAKNNFGSVDKFLGDLSYPMYILHYPILGITIKLMFLIKINPDELWLSFIVSLAINLVLTSILSVFALKCIDSPIQKLRKKIVNT